MNRLRLRLNNLHKFIQLRKDQSQTSTSPDILKRFDLFIFRERGREGKKRRREISMCGCLSWDSLPRTGDLASNPGFCPNWKSNQQPFGSQASTQSTEPHQSGPSLDFKVRLLYHEKFQKVVLDHSVTIPWRLVKAAL